MMASFSLQTTVFINSWATLCQQAPLSARLGRVHDALLFLLWAFARLRELFQWPNFAYFPHPGNTLVAKEVVSKPEGLWFESRGRHLDRIFIIPEGGWHQRLMVLRGRMTMSEACGCKVTLVGLRNCRLIIHVIRYKQCYVVWWLRYHRIYG